METKYRQCTYLCFLMFTKIFFVLFFFFTLKCFILYTEWGEWKLGECSVTCGTGEQTDTRTCLRGNCEGGKTRKTYCSKPPCPSKFF